MTDISEPTVPSDEGGSPPLPSINPLVEAWQREYESLIHQIDDVPAQIRQGREATALLSLDQAEDAFYALHRKVTNFYALFYRHLRILESEGSPRLAAKGGGLIAPLLLHENEPYDAKPFVYANLQEAGYSASHWYLKPVFLAEMDYLLDTLAALVEPEWGADLSFAEGSQQPEER